MQAQWCARKSLQSSGSLLAAAAGFQRGLACQDWNTASCVGLSSSRSKDRSWGPAQWGAGTRV